MRFEFGSVVEKCLWVCILGFILSIVVFPIQSEDLFMYLAIARNFFKNGHFATSDPFLYPAVKSWTILHQWLAYLIFYASYIVGGYTGIIFFKVLIIVATLALPLVWAYRSVQANLFWAASVLLAMLAMSFRMMERTSLFSDVLITVVLFLLLMELRRPSKWKFLLPPIFLFWVNVHPGFPTGWALCGLAILASLKKWRSREFQHLLGITAVSVLICLLNPRGLDGVLYPFIFSQNEGAVFRKLYFEWYPTMDPLFFWHSQTIYIFALISVNLFLLYKARSAKPVFEILASAFMIFYGLYAIRFVPTMCYALVLLNTALALKAKWPAWIAKVNYALLALALVLGVRNLVWGYDVISGHRNVGLGVDERVMPVKAAEQIDKIVILGNVFNAHMFGGYLAWAWDERRKIFYHGFVTDTDFYLKEYIGFYRNRETFDAQVAKYDIKLFILDRFVGEEPLLKILATHPGWQLAFMDDSSVIFVPKP